VLPRLPSRGDLLLRGHVLLTMDVGNLLLHCRLLAGPARFLLGSLAGPGLPLCGSGLLPGRGGLLPRCRHPLPSTRGLLLGLFMSCQLLLPRCRGLALRGEL